MSPQWGSRRLSHYVRPLVRLDGCRGVRLGHRVGRCRNGCGKRGRNCCGAWTGLIRVLGSTAEYEQVEQGARNVHNRPVVYRESCHGYKLFKSSEASIATTNYVSVAVRLRYSGISPGRPRSSLQLQTLVPVHLDVHQQTTTVWSSQVDGGGGSLPKVVRDSSSYSIQLMLLKYVKSRRYCQMLWIGSDQAASFRWA
jgi:hypothetical protein